MKVRELIEVLTKVNPENEVKVLNMRLPNDEVETVHVGDTAMKIMGVMKWRVMGFRDGHVQLSSAPREDSVAGFGIPFHEFARDWVLIPDDDDADESDEG